MAHKALLFFPKVKHYKGSKRWKGKPFELAGWQTFCVGNLFGWVEKLTALRRFDRALIEVPKKSGKTFLAAALGIKQGFFDGEAGSEVYSIATTRDQAALSWRDAREMVKANPFLDRRIKQYRGIFSLSNDATASIFQPLGRDKDSADGKNPYFVIADELHRHKDGELLNVMANSMAARDEPLMLEITTAGVRKETSIGWKHHLYATQILEGIQENESRFVFIAGADEEDRDNWQDEKVWIKANPSWGISVNPRNIRRTAQDAIGMPENRNDFLRFHLNFWVDQHSIWIPDEVWAACAVRQKLAELRGKTCYAGLDLGQTDDITALVLAFRDDDAPDETYDIFPFFWVPEPTVRKRVEKDKIRYDLWIEQGLLETTPKKTTDYSFVRERILAQRGEFNLKQVWYDPAEAAQLSTELEEETGDENFMVKCFQSAKSVNEATRKVSALVEAENLRHGNNAVLRWMNSNVQIVYDSAGYIRIDKANSSEKVDGMTALMMAIKGWIYHKEEETTESVYETRGPLVFGAP